MRNDLIGYLLDALEPHEQELVETHLGKDPQLRRDLEVISRGLQPLSLDKAHYEPPVGLAHRTCQFVAVQAKVMPAPPVVSVPNRWSMADLAMAAGIFLAATLLFWPAMNQSRFAARLAGCKYNLGQLGAALGNYSDQFQGQLPAAALSDISNGAGIYAVLLQEQGLIPETRIVICPASELADRVAEFHVPTLQELSRAQAERLAVLRRQMGGSYGYSLGWFVDGKYYPPKDLRKATCALMADAPNPALPHRFSSNHGGCGQNVLFGDFHVQYMTTCKVKGCSDHIFFNSAGKPLAGLGPDDSVIGASDESPVERPMAVEVFSPSLN
jgi:hypothetical protein